MTPEEINQAVSNSGLTMEELSTVLRIGKLTTRRAQLLGQLAANEQIVNTASVSKHLAVDQEIGRMREELILPIQIELTQIDNTLSGVVG